MKTESLVVGLILMILGGFQALRPDLLMRFQIWSQRVIMGAKYEPSERTYKIARVIGAIIAIMGLLILTGILE